MSTVYMKGNCVEAHLRCLPGVQVSDSALGVVFWLRTAVFAQSDQQEPQT